MSFEVGDRSLAQDRDMIDGLARRSDELFSSLAQISPSLEQLTDETAKMNLLLRNVIGDLNALSEKRFIENRVAEVHERKPAPKPPATVDDATPRPATEDELRSAVRLGLQSFGLLPAPELTVTETGYECFARERPFSLVIGSAAWLKADPLLHGGYYVGVAGGGGSGGGNARSSSGAPIEESLLSEAIEDLAVSPAFSPATDIEEATEAEEWFGQSQSERSGSLTADRAAGRVGNLADDSSSLSSSSDFSRSNISITDHHVRQGPGTARPQGGLFDNESDADDDHASEEDLFGPEKRKPSLTPVSTSRQKSKSGPAATPVESAIKDSDLPKPTIVTPSSGLSFLDELKNRTQQRATGPDSQNARNQAEAKQRGDGASTNANATHDRLLEEETGRRPQVSNGEVQQTKSSPDNKVPIVQNEDTSAVSTVADDNTGRRGSNVRKPAAVGHRQLSLFSDSDSDSDFPSLPAAAQSKSVPSNAAASTAIPPPKVGPQPKQTVSHPPTKVPSWLDSDQETDESSAALDARSNAASSGAARVGLGGTTSRSSSSSIVQQKTLPKRPSLFDSDSDSDADLFAPKSTTPSSTAAKNKPKPAGAAVKASPVLGTGESSGGKKADGKFVLPPLPSASVTEPARSEYDEIFAPRPTAAVNPGGIQQRPLAPVSLAPVDTKVPPGKQEEELSSREHIPKLLESLVKPPSSESEEEPVKETRRTVAKRPANLVLAKKPTNIFGSDSDDDLLFGGSAAKAPGKAGSTTASSTVDAGQPSKEPEAGQPVTEKSTTAAQSVAEDKTAVKSSPRRSTPEEISPQQEKDTRKMSDKSDAMKKIGVGLPTGLLQGLKLKQKELGIAAPERKSQSSSSSDSESKPRTAATAVGPVDKDTSKVPQAEQTASKIVENKGTLQILKGRSRGAAGRRPPTRAKTRGTAGTDANESKASESIDAVGRKDLSTNNKATPVPEERANVADIVEVTVPARKQHEDESGELRTARISPQDTTTTKAANDNAKLSQSDQKDPEVRLQVAETRPDDHDAVAPSRRSAQLDGGPTTKLFSSDSDDDLFARKTSPSVRDKTVHTTATEASKETPKNLEDNPLDDPLLALAAKARPLNSGGRQEEQRPGGGDRGTSGTFDGSTSTMTTTTTAAGQTKQCNRPDDVKVKLAARSLDLFEDSEDEDDLFKPTKESGATHTVPRTAVPKSSTTPSFTAAVNVSGKAPTTAARDGAKSLFGSDSDSDDLFKK